MADSLDPANLRRIANDAKPRIISEFRAAFERDIEDALKSAAQAGETHAGVKPPTPSGDLDSREVKRAVADNKMMLVARGFTVTVDRPSLRYPHYWMYIPWRK